MTMRDLQKSAIIAELVKTYRSRGYPCWETHLQKSIYFLQDLLDVPLEFDFLLYKYGPFSFELRDHLAAMQADEMIVVRPRDLGANFEPGQQVQYLETRFPTTIRNHQPFIDWVVDKLGAKGVKDLEPLATALYFAKQNPSEDVEHRAQRIVDAKPHVKPEEARRAVMLVDEWRDSKPL